MTARSRTPITLDEHRQLGLALASMRDELLRIRVWLANGQPMKNARLPKNHAAVRRIQAAYKQLDEARSAMENVLYDAYTEDQGARLQTYYPDPADRAAWQAQQRGGVQPDEAV